MQKLIEMAVLTPAEIEVIEREAQATVDEAVCFAKESPYPNIVNHVVDGLSKEFGADRCISTPIVEAGFTGAAIGAALTGMRPVVEVGNGCFLLRAYDEVTNEAAKYRYICGAGSLFKRISPCFSLNTRCSTI
jgi:pyruvate dehydrogenase E1 component beta subunit